MISMVCELAAAVKAVVFGNILFEDLLCGHLSRGGIEFSCRLQNSIKEDNSPLSELNKRSKIGIVAFDFVGKKRTPQVGIWR